MSRLYTLTRVILSGLILHSHLTNGHIVPMPEYSLLAEADAAPAAGSAQEPPSHTTTPTTSPLAASASGEALSPPPATLSFVTVPFFAIPTVTAQVLSFAGNRTVIPVAASPTPNPQITLPIVGEPSIPAAFTSQVSEEAKLRSIASANGITLSTSRSAPTRSATANITGLPLVFPIAAGAAASHDAAVSADTALPHLNGSVPWRYPTITLVLEGLRIEVPLPAELSRFFEDGAVYVRGVLEDFAAGGGMNATPINGGMDATGTGTKILPIVRPVPDLVGE